MRRIRKPDRNIFTVVLTICLIISVAAVSWANSVDVLQERAKNLYDVKDYRGALGLFQRILQEFPDNGSALDFSGWCLRYLGDWASAEKTLNHALEVLNGSEGRWVMVGLGETYLGAGNYQKAVSSFDTAISLAPEEEELVVRSLKGIAWAYASMGKEKEFDETITKLKEHDCEIAQQTVKEAASLLSASVKKQPEEPEELTDVVDNQAEAFNQGKSDQQVAKSDKEKTDKNGASSQNQEPIEVWGFVLGSPIQEALVSLEARGIGYTKDPEPSSYGENYYIFALPEPGPLPGFIQKDLGVLFYFINEYRGKVLKVGAVAFYEDCYDPMVMIQNKRMGMTVALDEKYGESVRCKNNGISSETAWVGSNRHAIWLTTNVSLDGTAAFELQYLDLQGFSQFLVDVSKQGTNL